MSTMNLIYINDRDLDSLLDFYTVLVAIVTSCAVSKLYQMIVLGI